MKITIKAKSSNNPDSCYNVISTYENARLKVRCNCPAGKYWKFCKHKWHLLGGNTDMLFDESDKEPLSTVVQWADERDYTSLYDKINQLEAEKDRLKKEIANEKKSVEQRMKKGF